MTLPNAIKCVRCGRGWVYQWGMPLSGRHFPETCNRCGATWIKGVFRAPRNAALAVMGSS